MNLKTRLFSLVLALSVLLGGCAQTLPTPIETAGESLTVSFLDVGQADCALLECGGEFMLIDGGNREDSQLVVSYLEQQGVPGACGGGVHPRSRGSCGRPARGAGGVPYQSGLRPHPHLFLQNLR